MLSKLAEAVFEDFAAAGLNPAPRDVVRLNALALKLESAKARRAGTAMGLLPRVAQLDEGLFFREPTIAHEIWCDEVERLLKPGDYQSLLAVKAYALSRPAEELARSDRPREIRRAVERFAKTLGRFTHEQIFAAVDYVLYGRDATAFEYPPPMKGDEAADADEVDWASSYAVGVLNEGRAVLFGLSGAEMRSMTRAELEAVIERSAQVHGLIDNDKRESRLTGEFYAAVGEIKERLEAERRPAGEESEGNG